MLESLNRSLRRAYGHPLLYTGKRLECPVCGGRFRRMRHGRGRRDVQCPRCGSYERVRALWLFLRDQTDLGAGKRRVLHFAPEPSIAAAIEALPGVDYVSADIAAGVAMEVVDITAIPPALGSFDIVICSHVLEHVPDDRRAMAEVFRVLNPGGSAYFMQPVDFGRAETYEDPAIVTPEERVRAFGQFNHVRVYGRDIRERLGDAGFEVTERRYTEELDPADRARYALQDGDATAREDVVFVAAKPAQPSEKTDR
jgi:SAM-dependent methyltransferase